MEQSSKNGNPTDHCKVCQTLTPDRIKDLETDFLSALPKLHDKKTLVRKYGIDYNSIVAHIGQRSRHRKELTTLNQNGHV